MNRPAEDLTAPMQNTHQDVNQVRVKTQSPYAPDDPEPVFFQEVTHKAKRRLEQQMHVRPWTIVGGAVAAGFVMGSLTGTKTSTGLIPWGVGRMAVKSATDAALRRAVKRA